MKDAQLEQLQSLFFATKQLIRQELPQDERRDPNAWLRVETLHFVSRESQPTMQDIAHYLRVKAPSATSLVRNIVKTGLARRFVAPEDKRVVRVALTPAGEQALRKYRADAAGALRKVFSTLNDAEIRLLIEILAKVRDHR